MQIKQIPWWEWGGQSFSAQDLCPFLASELWEAVVGLRSKSTEGLVQEGQEQCQVLAIQWWTKLIYSFVRQIGFSKILTDKPKTITWWCPVWIPFQGPWTLSYRSWGTTEDFGAGKWKDHKIINWIFPLQLQWLIQKNEYLTRKAEGPQIILYNLCLL